GTSVPAPNLASGAVDAVKLNGSPLLPYTHFSVCLSKERRMAHFVAWNIDGGQLKSLTRTGLRFEFDPRVNEQFQVGDELYSDNRLDRGHIARRADLVWGPRPEGGSGEQGLLLLHEHHAPAPGVQPVRASRPLGPA